MENPVLQELTIMDTISTPDELILIESLELLITTMHSFRALPVVVVLSAAYNICHNIVSQ
jgi:hypothetical protein